MLSQSLLSLALYLSAVEAVYQGFNYGSTNSDDSVKSYDDFKNEFTTAQNLVGTSGFTSARLYTMIQGGTTDTVIEAIQAAVDTDTSLLLGLWASGDTFSNELTALKSAISSFPDLSSQIAGISVGSEDLYRISPTGVEADAGVGAEPSTIVSYISQVKEAISGTNWDGVSIGHVDTWTAWANSSNSDVVDACDWIGMDAYPYFQNTQSNSIDNAKSLFNDALTETTSFANGKDVWITETGWPVSGPVENEATASTTNAKTYWDQVGCPNFGVTNIWWYDLYDSGASPSFGVVDSDTNTTPLYDLSCSNVTNSSSTSSATSTLASGASATGTGSGSVVATGAGLSPSGSGNSPYGNGTSSAGSASSSGSANGTSSSGSSGSSTSGNSSSSSSESGSSSSSTSKPYTGSASTVAAAGGSMIGIFGAVAAAVLLL